MKPNVDETLPKMAKIFNGATADDAAKSDMNLETCKSDLK